MYDQADVSCLVENEEGENVASTNLDVNYAPTILLHPRSNFLFFKHILKLSKKIPKRETLGPFNWHVLGSNGCSRKAMKN